MSALIPLAIFGDFAFSELLLAAAVALMIFGKRLPEVAVRVAAHVARLRRSLTQMWREAGIEDELRRVRREVERDLPDIRNPKKLIRNMGERYLEGVDPGADDALAGLGTEPQRAAPQSSEPGPDTDEPKEDEPWPPDPGGTEDRESA